MSFFGYNFELASPKALSSPVNLAMSHAAARQDSIASLLKSEVVAIPLFFPKKKLKT